MRTLLLLPLVVAHVAPGQHPGQQTGDGIHDADSSLLTSGCEAGLVNLDQHGPSKGVLDAMKSNCASYFESPNTCGEADCENGVWINPPNPSIAKIANECTSRDFKASELCCICGGGGAKVEEDPHLVGGHGDTADFHGKHNTYFNLLSHTNFSVTALFREAKYKDRDDARTVHGSYMTSGYVNVKTTSGNTLQFSLEAGESRKPNNAEITKLDAHGKQFYKMKFGSTASNYQEENVRAALYTPSAGAAKNGDAAALVVTLEGRWSVNISAHQVNGYFDDSEVNKNGKHKEMYRVDVMVLPHSSKIESEAVTPHGLIGQSFDGDDLIVDGKKDDYEKSLVVTTAQGEGAIEGTWEDYVVAGPFETAFKYTRFSVTEGKPRDVAKLSGAKRVRKTGPVKARFWARS